MPAGSPTTSSPCSSASCFTSLPQKTIPLAAIADTSEQGRSSQIFGGRDVRDFKKSYSSCLECCIWGRTDSSLPPNLLVNRRELRRGAAALYWANLRLISPEMFRSTFRKYASASFKQRRKGVCHSPKDPTSRAVPLISVLAGRADRRTYMTEGHQVMEGEGCEVRGVQAEVSTCHSCVPVTHDEAVR
ncbi:hypothetical protein JAAARDRAFT_217366 [Jaapia argillacea MUCL 33604]|uniref:Uncharacterized protein n=1 Tax=Jaapia argillacea MUCL 33604 TaxID=933084 RepID=A0A067QNC5_9AGAM|nr:hypothetical protein JAAARDRAFT_217366 [Jaapia argillacea MUCL 33604]